MYMPDVTDQAGSWDIIRAGGLQPVLQMLTALVRACLT